MTNGSGRLSEDAGVMSGKRDLVAITWDGHGPLHRYIHVDQDPSFDVLTLDYSGGAKLPFKLTERHFFRSRRTEGKGQTFQDVAKFLSESQESYRYVGILDDDLILRISDIQYLLHVAECFDLDSFAPALGEDGSHSHLHTLKKGNRLLHKVDWVEVMMPFYKEKLFEMASPFFQHTISSWGIDKYVMPLVQKIAGMQRVAIIDGVAAAHVRPVRSPTNMFSNGKNPFEEMELIRGQCIRYIEENYPELIPTDWFRATFGFLGRGARLKRRVQNIFSKEKPLDVNWA